MRIFLIVIAASFVIDSAASGQNASTEYILYKKAEAETFASDKIRYTIPLGKMGTPEARKYLIAMFGGKTMWSREAAAKGLFYIKDKEISRLLVEGFVSDASIKGVLFEGIKKDIPYYYDDVISVYESLKSEKGFFKEKIRKGLLDIFAVAAYPPGEKYLKSIITDTASIDRGNALELLGRYYQKNYNFIIVYKNEPPLRHYVVEYLAAHGSADDLPIFKEVIAGNEPPANRLPAYEGIRKWGAHELKTKIFLDALDDKNETIVQGALLTFEKIESMDLMRKLKCIVINGTNQKTRMLAASGLIRYSDKQIIPALIAALNEKYSPKEREGIDIFLTGLTFGITDIMNDLSEKSRKSDFRSIMGRVNSKLIELAGVSLTADYIVWRDWAILKGYTIESRNIIQYLFSPDKKTRKSAADSASQILGQVNSRKYAEIKNINTEDEWAVNIALAEDLLKKGILLKDEDECR